MKQANFFFISNLFLRANFVQHTTINFEWKWTMIIPASTKNCLTICVVDYVSFPTG